MRDFDEGVITARWGKQFQNKANGKRVQNKTNKAPQGQDNKEQSKMKHMSLTQTTEVT